MSQTTNIPADQLESLWATADNTTPWLQELQQDALKAFRQNGFPTQAQEDWKYTDISDVAENYPQWLAGSPTTNPEPPATLPIENALQITFVDGRYEAALSSAEKLPEGLLIGSLDEVAKHNPEIRARLGQLAGNNDSGLVAINTAFASDAFVMFLENNCELKQPISLHFHTASSGISTQPRLLINMGKHSRATLIENYTSTGPAIINSVTEIFCDSGAKLTRCTLQDQHISAWHTAAQYAQIGPDASLFNTQLDIGARLSRNELNIALTGRGAHAEARGLFIADAERHMDSRITVEHAAPDTTSRERYRGILADKARGVFNGRILVQQAAQKTSADLTNRNLLLSPGAEIDTKPELEIYADDVKCAHGSTTGQLDETALFYLLSRGIDKDQARTLLIRAFAAELLTDLEVPAFNEAVQRILIKLGQGE